MSLSSPLPTGVLPLLLVAAQALFACGTDSADGASSDGGSTPRDASTSDGGSSLPPDDNSPGEGLRERSAANVLFSGHSLLDNPITDWTAAIAQAKGDTIGWEEQIVIGSPIRIRTRGNDSGGSSWSGYAMGKNRSGQDKNMLDEIKSPAQLPGGQKYDTLLITERHDPLNTAQWENSVGYLRHYHDRLVEQSASAQTYLYQCWPDIDKNAPDAWIAYQSQELILWECIASKANLSLQANNKPAAIHVIPGSVALAKFVQEVIAGKVPGLTGSSRENLDRIFADDVHLGAPGQYLIAAVHYASVFGKSPVGAHATSELSAETADAIEKIAWNVVQDYTSKGPGAKRTMEDCRARISADVCPAYYSIRGDSPPGQGCGYWSGGESPFNLPDDKLPLPAP